jgi:mannose-6-phosphate isomerase-like protein (cupin superfamily)
MQALINNFFFATPENRPLISTMLQAALSDVPFHTNTNAVKRYVAKDFPVLVAVHEVSAITSTPAEYTQPHVHEDEDEINIIVSTEELLYKIQLGEEIFTVQSNSSIWIPRGVIHSANVLKGAGYFITMRMN